MHDKLSTTPLRHALRRSAAATLSALSVFSVFAVTAALASSAYAAAPTPMKPGVYEEVVRGNNGPLTVRVTLTADRIEAVAIGDNYETDYIALEPMKNVATEVVRRQRLDVDTVSGATESTTALLRAVFQAVTEAGGDLNDFLKAGAVDPATLPGKTVKADVVVVGGGGSGLTAALTAAKAGKKVLLIEKHETLGGSTALACCSLSKPSSLDTGDATPAGEALRKTEPQLLALLSELGVNFKNDNAGSLAVEGMVLVKKLEDAARAAGVEMLTSTALYKIERADGSDGAVTRVLAQDGATRYEVDAPAVVLATGGFAYDIERVISTMPRWTALTPFATAAKTSTGDGIRIAETAGAAVFEDAHVIAGGLGARYAELDRAVALSGGIPNGVLVNGRGVRFVNEAVPDLTEKAAMEDITWVIFDAADAKRAETFSKYLTFEVVVDATDWLTLARRMGVHAETLAQTMKTYNEGVAAKKDAFGKPAEHLRAVTKTPYYAVRLWPRIAGTVGGLQTNEGMAVLDRSGKPIPGLFAAGETANGSLLKGAVPVGASLTEALASGLIAGDAAAKAGK